jgi:hypothetical protein
MYSLSADQGPNAMLPGQIQCTECYVDFMSGKLRMICLLTQLQSETYIFTHCRLRLECPHSPHSLTHSFSLSHTHTHTHLDIDASDTTFIVGQGYKILNQVY